MHPRTLFLFKEENSSFPLSRPFSPRASCSQENHRTKAQAGCQPYREPRKHAECVQRGHPSVPLGRGYKPHVSRMGKNTWSRTGNKRSFHSRTEGLVLAGNTHLRCDPETVANLPHIRGADGRTEEKPQAQPVAITQLSSFGGLRKGVKIDVDLLGRWGVIQGNTVSTRRLRQSHSHRKCGVESFFSWTLSLKEKQSSSNQEGKIKNKVK